MAFKFIDKIRAGKKKKKSPQVWNDKTITLNLSLFNIEWRFKAKSERIYAIKDSYISWHKS